MKHFFALKVLGYQFHVTSSHPQAVSDEAAKVIYQMKRATSTRDKNSETTQVQKKILRKKNKTFMDAI